MDCALAKELYDAGFPKSPTFKCCTDTPHIVCSETDGIARDSCHMKVDNSPTLSELIAACDQASHFVSVGRATHLKGGDQWEAKIENWDNYREAGDEVIEWKSGPTPEEAVARLWLALKK